MAQPALTPEFIAATQAKARSDYNKRMLATANKPQPWKPTYRRDGTSIPAPVERGFFDSVGDYFNPSPDAAWMGQSAFMSPTGPASSAERAIVEDFDEVYDEPFTAEDIVIPELPVIRKPKGKKKAKAKGPSLDEMRAMQSAFVPAKPVMSRHQRNLNLLNPTAADFGDDY